MSENQKLTLDDIKKELFAWFPRVAHKKRGLPGGGTHFFLPHQAICDRLNDICFSDWTEEYSDPVVTGKITTVRCTLTICGVSRVGVADNKTEPELNEEGKEKIIGSVVINTSRAAFKNAAERFGIGTYLNHQKDNNELRDYLNGRTQKAIATPPQNAPRTAQTPKQVNPPQNQNKVPSQPSAPNLTGLYPRHIKIINHILSELKVPSAYATFVSENQFQGKTPDHLDSESLHLFIEKLVIKGKEAEFKKDHAALLESYRRQLNKCNRDPVLAIETWEVDF